MKILLVTDAPQASGGAELVTHQISCGLMNLGCAVAVLRPSPPLRGSDYAGTAEAYTLDTSTRRGIEASISETINHFQPDLLHVTGARWPVINRVDAIARYLPWILSIHNLPPSEIQFGRFYGRNHIHYQARNARYSPNALLWAIGLRRWGFARLVCHSSEVESRLRQSGCPRDRIALVPLGHAANNPSPNGGSGISFSPASHPRLLTIAGIVHHKGLHDCIRAIAPLRDTFPELTYLIIGGRRDPAYASYLEALVVRIGLGSQVSFIYDASEELKWCALRHADLYIQPSHEEGFCLSFLDAAMVVPRLLGTATGEIPLIAGNDPDCAVVAPKDLRGLRDNVLRLLHITTTDSSLQARRLRLRDKYSWPSALAQLFSLYKELLRRPVDHTEDRSAWNTKELHLT